MSDPVLNQVIEDFNFELAGEQSSLSAYRGSWLVLFFYPRDNTPGCTTEASDFRDRLADFEKLGAKILGVSRDNQRSHERFSDKIALNYPLVADTDEALCQHFGVMKEKMMYGKQVRGIERSTFLIDPDGVLRYEWRKLRAKDHAAAVLETLRSL